MLIGLLAKTAILLTEYAAERRKAGMGLIASAVSAAKARFRPILMTVLTMIFGLFPLVVATGVGANGNRSLGTGVVGGMFIGTLALLFIVPVLFISFFVSFIIHYYIKTVDKYTLISHIKHAKEENSFNF